MTRVNCLSVCLEHHLPRWSPNFVLPPSLSALIHPTSTRTTTLWPPWKIGLARFGRHVIWGATQGGGVSHSTHLIWWWIHISKIIRVQCALSTSRSIVVSVKTWLHKQAGLICEHLLTARAVVGTSNILLDNQGDLTTACGLNERDIL